MMPDLGKYAGAVLSSYGATIGLLAALLVLSVLRARSVKRKLDAAEERRNG